MPPTPFFTIITATYNAADVLSDLLDSLAAQTYRNFEVLIQDGGSNDATLEIASGYKDKLNIRWAFETDTGIYDAWNKALPRANGRWFLFLGADDRLYDENTLHTAAGMLANVQDSVLFACGDLEIVTAEGRVRETIVPQTSEALHILRQGRMPAGHPAVFHRCRVFSAQSFDSTYQIAGDYDFWCRTWTEPPQAAKLEMTVTCMGAGGVSDSPFGALAMRKEVWRIQHRYFPGSRPLGQRLILYAKSYILSILCACCGKKYAPIVLDALRKIRGLPPVWADKLRG